MFCLFSFPFFLSFLFLFSSFPFFLFIFCQHLGGGGGFPHRPPPPDPLLVRVGLCSTCGLWMTLNTSVVVKGMTINPGNTMGVNLIHSVYLRNLLEFSEHNKEILYIRVSISAWCLDGDMASHFCGSTQPNIWQVWVRIRGRERMEWALLL